MEVFPNEFEIYCSECDYSIKNGLKEDVITELAEDGGYIMYDQEGGYITECPNCHQDTLIIL